MMLRITPPSMLRFLAVDGQPPDQKNLPLSVIFFKAPHATKP